MDFFVDQNHNLHILNQTEAALAPQTFADKINFKIKDEIKRRIQDRREKKNSLQPLHYRQSTTFSPKWLMEYNVKHDREQNYNHLQCVCLFLTHLFVVVFLLCRQSMLHGAWNEKFDSVLYALWDYTLVDALTSNIENTNAIRWTEKHFEFYRQFTALANKCDSCFQLAEILFFLYPNGWNELIWTNGFCWMEWYEIDIN